MQTTGPLMDYSYRGKVTQVHWLEAIRRINTKTGLLVRRRDGTHKVIWLGNRGGPWLAMDSDLRYQPEGK